MVTIMMMGRSSMDAGDPYPLGFPFPSKWMAIGPFSVTLPIMAISRDASIRTQDRISRIMWNLV